MTEFKTGDRVRVRNLSALGSYVGQTGEVVLVKDYPGTSIVRCRVRMDGPLSVEALFALHELEAAPADTP